MKVTALNGSPRKQGNTFFAIEKVFEQLENIETNQIYLYDYDIQPCKACIACFKNKDCKCALDPDFNQLYRARGSPVYAGGVTGQMKLFLDKLAMISKAMETPLPEK